VGDADSTYRTGFALDPDPADLPFRRELSLGPLIAAWERVARQDAGLQAEMARTVLAGLERAPELRHPIDDPAVLDRHADLVGALMAEVFAPAAREDALGAAIPPFELRAFFATPPFRRLLTDGGGALRARVNLDPQAYATGRLLHAFSAVLARFHGLELELDYPIIFTAEDPDTGLERHVRIRYDTRFLEIRAARPVRPLSPEARARAQARATDVGALGELVRLEDFVFSGFVVVRAFDVTDQEVLAALGRELIDRATIVSDERFRGLQQKLRSLFRRPDLRLGLAAFQGPRVLILNYGCRLEHGCIFADSEHRLMSDFAGSIYQRAVTAGTPLLVEDLEGEPGRTKVEDALLDLGLRNVVVAPLVYQDRPIGTLELGSPTPGGLGPMAVLKLRQVLPLFAMAVRRTLDELEGRVQAVIKEQCTAIHPSVEWRFRRAVLDAIEQRREGDVTELEPIVFRDVHPLYAATDIRGSSVQRNLAVQADLGAQLRLALAVVETAAAARRLPALDEVAYRIGRHAARLERGLASGDEALVLSFLRQHVEPLFEHLAGFAPAVRERIDAYRAALDPAAGSVYRQRRAYETSVTTVADTISAYLDAEEDVAQAMFPHYFERQRTDGVDYTIYVGGSLVESGEFDELYLRNLRLWQLMVACGIARRTEAVRAGLPVPLETTHLILAHHAPLSIRFRFDEKRFDVEGAYDIRYEVIKKRIDKAVVQGTGERVTQPGRIAIVYSQPGEGVEYRGYLEYLAARGYLRGEVEELALDELQGVQGLRALRVAVDLSAPAAAGGAAAREAHAAAHAR